MKTDVQREISQAVQGETAEPRKEAEVSAGVAGEGALSSSGGFPKDFLAGTLSE
jgi:hypothetical protein